MSNLEEYKQQKSLQEQRRTGKAKVEKDNIDEINPYMPVFIAKAPWYMKTDDESLDHQKSTLKPQDDPDTWYQRGQRAGPAATKYRKGACANCGAITHKARDCLERPRKVGAKWTGKDIQQDEVIQQISLGFEGKRDRWNGYDSREQLKTVKDWELVEEKRRQIREKLAQEKLERAAKAAADGDVDFKQSDSDSDDKSDEGKYAEEAEMVGQVVGSFNKTKMTLRNLRLREDTAKYLRNLDVNSAHYDPKTRSMQENPYEKSDPNNVDFVGDGFLRNTGDVQDHTELQSFAWEVEKRGTQLHLNANPTEMALLNKKLAQERKDTVNVKKTSILARYGGQEHLDSIPKELLLAQTENYVEYSQQGQIIKGQEKATAKSKYLEDVYVLC